MEDNFSYNSIALIPMRGGSKSIPKKNIKLLAGKPLFYWGMKAIIDSKCADRVFVSTDSTEIINEVKKYFPEVVCIERPSEFAKDESSTESVVSHFNGLIDYQKMTLIQITSPLVKPKDFIDAHKKFLDESLDSLFTGVLQKRFNWSLEDIPLNYDPSARPRRQDFSGYIVENGAFYIFSKINFEKYGNRLGGKIGHHLMEENTLFEIDEPFDFKLLDFLMNEISFE